MEKDAGIEGYNVRRVKKEVCFACSVRSGDFHSVISRKQGQSNVRYDIISMAGCSADQLEYNYVKFWRQSVDGCQTHHPLQVAVFAKTNYT